MTLDFAVTATMLIIATASIIIAIVPNSGTTFVNTTSSPIGPVLGSDTPYLGR
ncbi:hypothetical protein AAA799P11_01344 [Marine Group I thaumarchaeote SCGC AAA799-P11]|uniref:Uncharacterized protein n=1 Tax=Marine Group I thaumarchaeote SCGC AAA799-P11 TaxID=1502295 RepID=A0A087RVB4_9ARCH|nr:hypothetical protein AAA799P11_01344 [Marine Group I thaumarchaeote SCGC AAA799-P11]